MLIIGHILFFVVLGVIIFSFFKSKNQKENNIIKKDVVNVLTFILLFILYYFVIGIISMILLSMASSNSGSDSGFWAYSIILGIGLAPILSLITTIKLNKKKKNTEFVEHINDNDTIQKKQRNSIIIISVIIVSFIGIVIIISTIFNFNIPSKIEDNKFKQDLEEEQKNSKEENIKKYLKDNYNVSLSYKNKNDKIEDVEFIIGKNYKKEELELFTQDMKKVFNYIDNNFYDIDYAVLNFENGNPFYEGEYEYSKTKGSINENSMTNELWIMVNSEYIFIEKQ